MRSLWVKLTLAFIAVTVVAVGLVAFWANRAITGQFHLYISRGGQRRAAVLAPFFADYYRRVGGWSGVETLITEWTTSKEWWRDMGGWRVGRHGPTMMEEHPGMSGPPLKERLILADEQGKVVADSLGEAVGETLPAEALAQGSPITVDGRQVGTLLITWGELSGFSGPEREFLAAVNRSLLWAGLLAGGLAVVLGLALAWQMTAPLQQLRRAAAAIARGDLSKRVEVHSGDEIGELGQTFNEMAAALQRDEELRRHMIADVAHELRTPLSVIRGNLEALLDGVYPPDPQHIVPVYEETLLLQRLVEDLRVLSLAEAGQLPLEQEELDIGELVQGVVETARATAQEKQITLEAQVEQPLLVQGDAQRLRQVLNNLLSNALRYTPSGGRITVMARRVGQEAQVTVRDTGPGIPPEDLPHIFDRFWRGDRSRTRASGGSGLGLSIARQLVEAHGGRIWAESQPGQGASFHFTLPLSQPSL